MTVVEIQAKQASLEAEQNTALEAAKVLTPATPEFDEAYQRYLSAKAAIAKIPEEIAKAKQAENAEAIAQCATQIGEALVQLIEGLKVAELLGTPVIALIYALDADNTPLVVFNPIIKQKATGPSAGKGKGAGRTVVVDPNGEKWSLTKFVIAHATEAEKLTPEYKYPHTRVDTQPKFEAFCTEHSLTGYTYETAPSATEGTPAS